jgi:hypothetical protein
MLVLALAWRSIRRLNFSSAESLISTAIQYVEQAQAEGLLEDCQYTYASSSTRAMSSAR